MKRLFTGVFAAVFVLSLLLFPQRSFAAAGIFGGGGFLSAFRTVQTKVQRMHTRFVRLFGAREGEGLDARIEVLPFDDISDGDIEDLEDAPRARVWVIGEFREIFWEYEDLKESVTKLYLSQDEDTSAGLEASRSLLVLLPARRGVADSDSYEFDASLVRPGEYVIEVCNGDVCGASEEISFVMKEEETEEPEEV